jgi:hypothetical protein
VWRVERVAPPVGELFQRRATYKRVWQQNNEKGIMGTSKVNYIIVEIYVRWTKL